MAAHAAAAAAQAARTTAAARVLSRSSAKPPNILVLCDTNPQSPSNGVTHYQQAKSELTSCIGHDKYVVYWLMLEDLGQVPWRENCQLLIAPAGLNMAAATLQCLVGYVEEGGQCLSMSKSLSEAVLGCHEAAVEQSQLCQVTPCVPGKEQLEGFVAPLLFLAGTEKKEVSYSPLAKLCDAGSESPCVQLVDTPAHSRFIASSVDLLSPSFEGLNISMVTELKQSTQARHLFLSAVLEQLGVECDPAPVPALSHTYLFSKSDKVRDEYVYVCMYVCMSVKHNNKHISKNFLVFSFKTMVDFMLIMHGSILGVSFSLPHMIKWNILMTKNNIFLILSCSNNVSYL